MSPEYRKPPLFFSAHIETIFPALFRKVDDIRFERERLIIPDGDFLDLDWLKKRGSKSVAIISHGLEGNSTRAYVKGMARALHSNNMDVLAWNFRGCSGEMNKLLRFYHSGATEDLRVVIDHAVAKGYEELYLVAFSLGGNMTLKYLGEQKKDTVIKKAAVFSVPLDLHNSCIEISKPRNRLYSRRFLGNLKQKVITKSRIMKGLDIMEIDKIKTLMDFDDRYTAPLHGYKDAIDYYTRCSSVHFLQDISIPVLIVNALNDPFLGESCYPREQMTKNPFITFETPAFGGHVGFTQFNKNGLYWSEERAISFLTTTP